jgi:DNA-binding NtrC family response regulator
MMNKVARVFSEVDVLEMEIRRKSDEVARLRRHLATLTGNGRVLGEVVGQDNVPADASSGAAGEPVLPLAEVERRYVLEVLAHFKGNRTHTARALGIGTNTLWRKLKAWGEPPARS